MKMIRGSAALTHHIRFGTEFADTPMGEVDNLVLLRWSIATKVDGPAMRVTGIPQRGSGT
ncbi:hypothetical protein ACIRL2_31990 [Embleya sp. NPDC127516]|uniref:hypothetical protein n=1 Tax=Embleya sp. NPDC127516 TaxID=3363990 RepID=UPI00380CF7D1